MADSSFKSGFVAILGRPNVGKSTLLNALVRDKISIISPIPQTTRYQIRGILNLEQAQIVFVDTPGLHAFKDKLARHLNTIARHSLEGCDLVVYVVDVSRRPGREEEQVIDLLAKQPLKVLMVLNKIDLGAKHLNQYIELWQERLAKKGQELLIYYMPASALTGKNMDQLLKVIVENLPAQPAFYERDRRTDFPLKFRIADCIREKLFLRLTRELPHSLAVEVDEIEERQTKKGKPFTYIGVVVYVQRPSQKKIVIGTKGEGLKQAGSQARVDLEKMLEAKVFLDIWVKVLPDWQEKPRVLRELGYWWA